MENQNFFDVEQEFFLIDSNNLQNVKTKLYGYSIQESGIYEDDNLTEDAISGLNGCGVYVYVEAKAGKISIQQDFNGSYGICFFQHGDYFALSNSFFRLLEYIKTRFPISLNRDYANDILAEWLTNSVAYAETPIQEITVLGKDTFIEIDIQKREFIFKQIDYGEATLWLNSAEGIETLDRWFLRWTSIFRKMAEQTNQIRVDLSGGFDSRIMLMLALQSGINLNEIQIFSIHDTLHTHKEDYEIASEIAAYYGFVLNHGTFQNSSLPYSMDDIVNISFYTKMGFHKELFFKYFKSEWKRYRITGAGGETVRAYWNMSAQEFRDKMCVATQRYSPAIRDDMKESIHRLIDSSYKVIAKKHQLVDDNSMDYPLYMYREIRDRTHFGRASVENYFSNLYDLSPYIDPDLLKLRLSDPKCLDNNLLMALIYVRYCPKLLDFKFEGGRFIDPATIKFANKINKKFGGGGGVISAIGERNGMFHVNVRDMEVFKLRNTSVNQMVPKGTPEKYLKSVFDSVALQKMFAICFDEEIYHKADIFFHKNNFYPMRHCYSVIAVTKVIEDVMASRAIFLPGIVSSMNRFIRENYYRAECNIETSGLAAEIEELKEENRLLKAQNDKNKILKRIRKKLKNYKPEVGK